MKQELILNPAQIIGVLLQARSKVDVWGRGTGKSAGIAWDVNLINTTMPRAICSVTGQTYGQLLTRTLPSTFKMLEMMGYKQHISAKDPGNYVICRRPPDHFIKPYEHVLKYDTLISFSNGNALVLLSQDRAGAARGANVDYEFVDEALTIDKKRYDEETSPTNRGNENIFGKSSKNPVLWHHGFHYSSSMPYTAEQRWLLDLGNYYEKERGIQIFVIWNEIVRKQIQLFDLEGTSDFKLLWNEIVRLKQKIAPFISKEGVLFTFANAFDNIRNVGYSFLKREYEKQSRFIFMVELMNMIVDKVEDCYYPITDKHVYYNASNDSYIRDVAENTGYDWTTLASDDCRKDSDCNPELPLEISFDWGARIALMTVSQEKYIDFSTGESSPVAIQTFINEFFVKPSETPKVMIHELIAKFCDYYENHKTRVIHYFRDRYGDHRQANSSESYNEMAIAQLISRGWAIVPYVHKGMEPPQHDKFLLMQAIFKGVESGFPRVRFNGINCRYTLISMNNTRVTEHDGKFEKDKKSESSKSGVLPEEATHFGDAVDKILWTKFGKSLRGKTTFIPIKTN